MLDIGGIVRIFEEIEQRLVQSLKRNLGRHKDEEKEYEKNWSAWQAEKLRSLERFRKENAYIMAEYTEQIDSDTRQIMQEEFEQGVNGADVPPAEPVPDLPAEIRPEPQFFGVDTTKVNKLIEDISYLEKNAETAALRMTDDVYRQTVNRVQLAMSTGSMTLQQAIDIAVKDFLDQGINCIVYRDGRRVNIADYVRMALRTTATRAALQGKSAKYKALGYDTVQVSSYGMCSKTCEPWQGRIYIEDTFSMWDGEVREQGGILWGKSNYCGKWFPLLSSAIEKGLFHPNCRHSINLWRDGDPLPESVDNSDSERRYKLEQQQRALEREIRKAKRKVEGFTDPENIKKAKAELRQAQKELKDFIDKVNADEGETVLRRDEGKEKVYEGEVPKAAEPVKESAPPEAETKPLEAPEPEIKEVPETAPEPPVSDAPVPEGKAVEVTVSEPEKAEGAYTEEPVPQAENVNNQSIDNSEKNGIIETEVKQEMNLVIDKFTPCLEDTETGELVPTVYEKATKKELSELQGWNFNWLDKDLKDSEIYKLCIVGDNNIQGLVAITDYQKDMAVYVNIAESAPHNLGKGKKYSGVGGHLFAIAAKISYDKGYGGFLFMDAKNIELVEHYRNTLGAVLIGRPHPYRMFVDEENAIKLLNTYTFEEG